MRRICLILIGTVILVTGCVKSVWHGYMSFNLEDEEVFGWNITTPFIRAVSGDSLGYMNTDRFGMMGPYLKYEFGEDRYDSLPVERVFIVNGVSLPLKDLDIRIDAFVFESEAWADTIIPPPMEWGEHEWEYKDLIRRFIQDTTVSLPVGASRVLTIPREVQKLTLRFDVVFSGLIVNVSARFSIRGPTLKALATSSCRA